MFYLFGGDYTIRLFNSSPWKITMLLIGKPSISMGHLYHGEVLNNQRVNPIRSHKIPLNHHKIPYSYGFPMVLAVFLLISYCHWLCSLSCRAAGRPGFDNSRHNTYLQIWETTGRFTRFGRKCWMVSMIFWYPFIAGWFIRENPMNQWMMWGYPLWLWKLPYCRFFGETYGSCPASWDRICMK